MKAVVIRGEQSDLDELSRIARSIGSYLFQERGNKIKVLGYGFIPLTSGETVKVAVLENDGCKSSLGRGDRNMT